MSSIFNRNKTFQPIKGHRNGTARYDLHKRAQATLGSGDLRGAVALPEGETLNEWLAVNTIAFVDQINIIYGTVSEFCTTTGCPHMSAGAKFEYLWKDDKQYKTPVHMPAPEYIARLMTWVEELLGNEAIFPTDDTTQMVYPRSFQNTVKNVFRRLFRIYAHIYYSHFDKIVALGAEAHLNSCFKHFMFFVAEFELVDKREQEPLKDLMQTLGITAEPGH